MARTLVISVLVVIAICLTSTIQCRRGNKRRGERELVLCELFNKTSNAPSWESGCGSADLECVSINPSDERRGRRRRHSSSSGSSSSEEDDDLEKKFCKPKMCSASTYVCENSTCVDGFCDISPGTDYYKYVTACNVDDEFRRDCAPHEVCAVKRPSDILISGVQLASLGECTKDHSRSIEVLCELFNETSNAPSWESKCGSADLECVPGEEQSGRRWRHSSSSEDDLVKKFCRPKNCSDSVCEDSTCIDGFCDIAPGTDNYKYVTACNVNDEVRRDCAPREVCAVKSPPDVLISGVQLTSLGECRKERDCGRSSESAGSN